MTERAAHSLLTSSPLPTARGAAIPPGMNRLQPPITFQRAVARWLLVCALMVALMVAVGGVTRLTESGLSIVKWNLISGTLPPLSDEAWQHEFDDYKSSPQFQKVNSDFTVADFQKIFWLEYIHRLIGRAIGLATFLPLLYFAARRALPRALLLRCAAIFLLIGAQGTVGWIMVASGLVDQPRVAPVKLAAHLLLAFSVFALMLWTRWQVLGIERSNLGACVATDSHSPRLPLLTRTALAFLTLQIFFGALVAGLRAGKTYNTWPLMDGRLVPTGLHTLDPWWLNHLENITTVQFQHRMLAMLVVAVIVVTIVMGWRHKNLHQLLRVILISILLQFTLGVATLLSVVNIALASAHQLVALFLVAVLLRLVYATPLPPNPQRK